MLRGPYSSLDTFKKFNIIGKIYFLANLLSVKSPLKPVQEYQLPLQTINNTLVHLHHMLEGDQEQDNKYQELRIDFERELLTSISKVRSARLKRALASKCIPVVNTSAFGNPPNPKLVGSFNKIADHTKDLKMLPRDPENPPKKTLRL